VAPHSHLKSFLVNGSERAIDESSADEAFSYRGLRRRRDVLFAGGGSSRRTGFAGSSCIGAAASPRLLVSIRLDAIDFGSRQ
jgi:hypothetical protein